MSAQFTSTHFNGGRMDERVLVVTRSTIPPLFGVYRLRLDRLVPNKMERARCEVALLTPRESVGFAYHYVLVSPAPLFFILARNQDYSRELGFGQDNCNTSMPVLRGLPIGADILIELIHHDNHRLILVDGSPVIHDLEQWSAWAFAARLPMPSDAVSLLVEEDAP